MSTTQTGIVATFRVAVAYVVAPLVAAPTLFGTAFLLQGESPLSAIIAPLTFHGMIATMVAAIAVLIGGTVLLLLCRQYERCQRVGIWAVTGAISGALFGLPLVGYGMAWVLGSAATTGAACAVAFRLIAGTPFQPAR